MAKNFRFESNEAHLWESDISQLVNIKFFALYGLGLLFCLSLISSFSFFGLIGTLVFSLLVFDKYVKVRDTKYDLTHERLRIVRGGLLHGRKTFEIDIDDLRDVELHEPFLHQIFGLGRIVLAFKGDPLVSTYKDLYEKQLHVIDGLKDSAKSREIIRAAMALLHESSWAIVER